MGGWVGGEGEKSRREKDTLYSVEGGGGRQKKGKQKRKRKRKREGERETAERLGRNFHFRFHG